VWSNNIIGETQIGQMTPSEGQVKRERTYHIRFQQNIDNCRIKRTVSDVMLYTIIGTNASYFLRNNIFYMIAF